MTKKVVGMDCLEVQGGVNHQYLMFDFDQYIPLPCEEV